jgi:mRNA-degrading endonuclease RelE of RelBE toxin-antitoxin system
MPNVSFTEDAAQSLDKLPKTIKARIIELIARLSRWPNVSGAKALSGTLAGHFRLRTGDYRLQFRIESSLQGEEVVIEQVGHRDGFYED